jgi:predicted acylesterase/phospholipase RssA
MPRVRPLGRIALSLSGGGYRAAAFHLGTLEVLERLGLLKDVEILSTVSGGTLAGLHYALSLARAEPFGVFRARLTAFLSETNVVVRAVQLSMGDAGERRASLIRGAAQVYASPDCFGDVRFSLLLDARIHLREIVVHSTDMASGLAFRFQKSRSVHAKNGTTRVWLDRGTARDVRLADMMAASSCFPAAFEPMALPDDFAWSTPPALKGDTTPRPLPLMDGGIFDNQGIDGLLLAERRWSKRKRPREVGLFFVSDTAQPQLDLFRFPAPARRGALRLGLALRVLQLVFGASALLLGRRLATDGTLALPFLASLGIAGGLVWLERRLRTEAVRRVPGLSWTRLLRLRLSELPWLVEARVRSLIALTADVFMKRIRGLGYKRLFGDDAYAKRRVANLIYELAQASDADPLAPSASQRAVCARAAATPTTLWLENDQQLRDLVACGRSTTCYTLLRHLEDRFGGRPPDEAADLVARARALWKALQADPEGDAASPRAARPRG